MIRLEKIASLIGHTNQVIDIGCDHGLLLKILFDKYNLKKGYAVDNKEGPLNNAKNNLSQYNCSFHIASSIKELLFKYLIDITKIDYIVIAGLGEKTILEILNDKLGANNYIISSHTGFEKIKEYFKNNNYYLKTHTLIKDSSIFYHILIFSITKSKNPILLKNDPLYNDYLDYEISKLKAIIAKNKGSKAIIEKKIANLQIQKIAKNK